MELFRYGCTALQGTNKTGALRPDAEGFYPLVLGGFNVYNAADAFYPWSSNVQALFAKTSSFQRRIANGALRGELGHPRPQPGQSDRDFMARVMDIYEPNVCQTFAEVWADDGLFKGRDGQPIIAILGRVKPFGAQKQALLDALETPRANACQSIRSLTDDRFVGGRLRKDVRAIITWDHVNEPGISIATKYNAPALESRDERELIISRDMLDELIERRRNGGYSAESSNTARSIILDLGARRPSRNELHFAVGGSSRWGR